MLHILNGDSTAGLLRQAGVPGSLTVWADVLHEGPVPGDLSPERWREIRARYIAECGYETYDAALGTQRRWDEGVARFAEHDEVVIWCEHDLFDQLLLIRHLAFFAGCDRGATRLSLVCIGEFPGVPQFKGLGQLAPHQLAALLDARQPVSAAQLTIGRAAWRAFTSPDPTSLESFLRSDTAPLPFLDRALRRHLEEFPSARGGLSRTEERILRLVRERASAPVDAFLALHRLEDCFYVGDASFWRILRELAGGRVPLIALETGVARHGLPDGTIRLTAAGEAVLDGRADAVRLRGIERWLGGVRLAGRTESPWRWDGTKLVRSGRG